MGYLFTAKVRAAIDRAAADPLPDGLLHPEPLLHEIRQQLLLHLLHPVLPVFLPVGPADSGWHRPYVAGLHGEVCVV